MNGHGKSLEQNLFSMRAYLLHLEESHLYSKEQLDYYKGVRKVVDDRLINRSIL
jgi:hypothetical protein